MPYRSDDLEGLRRSGNHRHHVVQTQLVGVISWRGEICVEQEEFISRCITLKDMEVEFDMKPSINIKIKSTL